MIAHHTLPDHPRLWYRLPHAGPGHTVRAMRAGDTYEVVRLSLNPRGDVVVHLRYADDGYVPPVLRAP